VLFRSRESHFKAEHTHTIEHEEKKLQLS